VGAALSFFNVLLKQFIAISIICSLNFKLALNQELANIKKILFGLIRVFAAGSGNNRSK